MTFFRGGRTGYKYEIKSPRWLLVYGHFGMLALQRTFIVLYSIVKWYDSDRSKIKVCFQLFGEIAAAPRVERTGGTLLLFLEDTRRKPENLQLQKAEFM